MRNLFSEFKEFITRGNVIDIAIGMIIGAAFSKIVSSLVSDVFMPVLGLLAGSIDLASLKIVFINADAANGVEEVAMNIGLFLQSVVDFLLIALVLFMMVKVFNSFRRTKEKKKVEALVPDDIKLLAEIRDLLKK
jgi:large conductance mechanosensitive channel